MRFALRAACVIALVALVAAGVSGARAAAGHAGSGIDLADLDTSCRACDDFRRYATGGWSRRSKIPAGYSSWGAFGEMYERNLAVLHRILDDAATKMRSSDPDEARVGTFYAACNDTQAIEAGGLQALQPELDRIAAIASPAALVAEIGRLDAFGVDNGLSFGSEADTRDSSRTIAGIGFGGLGMPDRDYYLNPRSAAVRAAYGHYLATQLGYLGEDSATATRHARAIVALETSLARATPPNADLRDPLATYHPMSVANVARIAPHIPWRAFLAGFGRSDVRFVDLSLPQYTRVFDRAVATVPLETWQAALRTHVVTTLTLGLPKRFDDARFAFFQRTLQGTRAPRPRWKRCVAAADHGLGESLGKLYVARAFPPESKARAVALVTNLQATLHDDITELPWMSAATRREAATKLAAYTKKIGYPDRWIDYGSLAFGPTDPFLIDLNKTQVFAQHRDLARIGKPTDRTPWGLTPQTVNAYYNPSNNEIVFPAGILQAPFFDTQADDAVVYGAIGAVIGHEMTHGFDDQGRQYDAKGNLRDWWTKSDAVNFSRRAKCIVDQFDGYSIENGIHENGRLVTGEAIADLGGTTIAYRAFTHTQQFKGQAKIDGYTPAQRFFLSYAQVWRSLETPQSARQAVLVDPHPDNRFRLIGTIGNMPAFAAAFGCAMNAPMVRKNRCDIW